MRITHLLLAGGAAAVLAIAVVAPAGAQQSRPQAGRAQAGRAPIRRQTAMRWTQILSKLNLSADQKSQVKALVQRSRDDAKAVREDTTLTPAQKRAKAQDIQKSLREGVMKLLNKDQKDKLKALIVSQRQPRPVLARWTAVLRKLDLTASQKTQDQSAMRDAQAKAKIVRESSLQPAEKRTKIQGIEKDFRERVMSFLTPDQKAKLREMLAAGPRPKAR